MVSQHHLQVLFFSGEGVRQVLDVLRLVFLYMRMERLQDFTDQRADLLGDAARLLDFVNLQQTVCELVSRSSTIKQETTKQPRQLIFLLPGKEK